MLQVSIRALEHLLIVVSGIMDRLRSLANLKLHPDKLILAAPILGRTLIGLLFFVLQSAAFAEVGRIKYSEGEAFVERGDQFLDAVAGLSVESSDVLVTGSDGRISVTFVDNSRFALRPSTRLSLSIFAINQTTRDGISIFALEGGGVAAVSGEISENNPGAMRIRTSTTLLGARGTRFVVKGGFSTIMVPEFEPPTLILLPGENSDPLGAVSITDIDGVETLVDVPYSIAQLFPNQIDTAVVGPEIERSYATLLGTLPRPPVQFTITFESRTTGLSGESLGVLPNIIDEFSRRPGADVVVVGHTDTVGQTLRNDRLSLMRAQLVREILIVEGIPAELILAIGRGERDPLVKTENNVSDERNRRVEVIVR